MILRSSIPSMAEGSRAPRAAAGRGITDSPVRWRRTCSSMAPRLIEIRLENSKSRIWSAHTGRLDFGELEFPCHMGRVSASYGPPVIMRWCPRMFFFFLTNTTYIQYNSIYTTAGQVCRVCRCIPGIPCGYATGCYTKHERHPSLGIVFDTLAHCIVLE